MSSYHDSFTYKNKNSAKDMNLIIASFEPDDGFTETFLSMDSVFEENFDGTKNFSYGAKYNSKATINITLIKNDGRDFSLTEFRDCARWLTGARTDSWMDMIVDDEVVYSFFGKVTDLQQYKMDGRTVALQVVFSSVTPWAFSSMQYKSVDFGGVLHINTEGYLYTSNALNESTLNMNMNDILFVNEECTQRFNYANPDVYDNVISIENIITFNINNLTDDLYTYINLDMRLENDGGEYLSIKNEYQSIDDEKISETTIIKNIEKKEVILLDSAQFIRSESTPEKVFGDNFNFVWPRLAPGLNRLSISSEGGSGSVQLTYRYPMKVGDNAMNLETSGGSIYCNTNEDYAVG